MSSPIDRVVETLNLACKTDLSAVQYLISRTAACTRAIEDHPTIPLNEDGNLTTLGLLNGVLRAATGQIIEAVWEDGSTRLLGFRTRPKETHELVAIPLLVYVKSSPGTEHPDELHENRLLSAIGAVPDVFSVFVAEDYENGELTVKDGDELPAQISDICDPSWVSHSTRPPSR